MRNVIYKKIGLENFGCYTSSLELEIENGKLIIISGKNGIGKTTIFDSISFTLYGITSKGLRAKDVVNNKVGKNAHTWLRFSIDEIEYRIDRYYSHTKYGNIAIMTRNEQPYKKGSKEVVDEVEKLLAPRKVFMNSLFFGQKVTSFFTDLDDTERKDIFRKILKLDELVIYYKQCSKIIEELNNLINQKDNNIIIQNSLLDDCQNQIILLKKEKEEFEIKHEKELEFHKCDYNKLKSTIKNLEKTIPEYYKKYDHDKSSHLGEVIDNYNYKLQELELTFKSLVEQIKIKMQNKKLDLEKQTELEKFKLNELTNKLIHSNKDKYQHEIESIKIKISENNGQLLLLNSTTENNNKEKDRLNKEKMKYIKNIFDNDISICPTCHQEINDLTKKDLENYIKDLENSIVELEIKIKDSKILIDQLKNDTINLNNNIKIMKQSTDNLIKKIEEKTSKKIQEINQKLENAIIKLRDLGNKIIQEKTQNLKNEKEEIIKSLEEVCQKRNVIDLGLDKINEFENELSNLKYQKEKLEELIEQTSKTEYNENRLISYKVRYKNIQKEIVSFKDEKEKMKRRYQILSVWKEAFSKSGIESMLIDQSIPFMNERVNEYLDILSFGRYVLSFDTVKQLGNKKEYRDKINLNVLDNESLADSREKFSGGQTRILDISIILTLCDLQSNIQGIKFNLMLFDEIFDSLDDDNIIRVAKLLRSLTKDKSIYIITHRHIDQIDADDELKL